MMEWLIPLMPLLTLLPPSVAAAWIAHRWLRTREGGAELRANMARLEHETEQLRAGQAELQERLDFAERVLRQLSDGAQRRVASE
jgi:hypothetical protein